MSLALSLSLAFHYYIINWFGHHTSFSSLSSLSLAWSLLAVAVGYAIAIAAGTSLSLLVIGYVNSHYVGNIIGHYATPSIRLIHTHILILIGHAWSSYWHHWHQWHIGHSPYHYHTHCHYCHVMALLHWSSLVNTHIVNINNTTVTHCSYVGYCYITLLSLALIGITALLRLAVLGWFRFIKKIVITSLLITPMLLLPLVTLSLVGRWLPPLSLLRHTPHVITLGITPLAYWLPLIIAIINWHYYQSLRMASLAWLCWSWLLLRHTIAAAGLIRPSLSLVPLSGIIVHWFTPGGLRHYCIFIATSIRYWSLLLSLVGHWLVGTLYAIIGIFSMPRLVIGHWLRH